MEERYACPCLRVSHGVNDFLLHEDGELVILSAAGAKDLLYLIRCDA
jgi:hypothetical protein